MNIVCWVSAPVWLTFAAFYATDEGLRPIALLDLAVALVLALMPFLHRFGARAAVIGYGVVAFPATFAICFLLGTDSGMQMHFVALAAGAVLIFGVSPIAPTVIVGVLSLVAIVMLEAFAPRDGGLLSETSMFAGFIGQAAAIVAIVCAVVFYAVREATLAEAAAEFEYERSEGLLTNVLPAAIATRLKSAAGAVISDRYEEASVLFADMAGFTAAASRIAPGELVSFLNTVFTRFDRLVERHGLEKIKTTGDNYMIVSGVPVARADHAAAVVALAVEMLEAADEIRAPGGDRVAIRIGIASGPVVAGVVGAKKFFYDVWGDTVNTASRMESTGLPGCIQVSPATYEAVKTQFAFECRGAIAVKGKGEMTPWLLRPGRASRDSDETTDRAAGTLL